ncbi:MAG: hypothetical protein JSV82_07510 [Planctomycetota bacterium]|nr:MAG: hypothetical protein JSV82_07510 [Planctomycetota bacterium]
MTKKIKFGKISAIVFLTILIWVWADLALDEQFTVSNVTISVAKSTNPNLWVSFDDRSSVSIEKMVLKGPASKVADVKRKLNDGSLILEFFLDADLEGMVNPGEYHLSALNFLRKSDQIRQLGLTIESCLPETTAVTVAGLVKKNLTVKCVDETQNPLNAAITEPTQVAMFVPEDWGGEKLIAKVQLSRREIDQTRLLAIKKVPFIELATGQIRSAPTAVKIKMPPDEDLLSDYTITTATLGFSLSANLQGKYKVEVANLDEIIRAITIRATPDAKRAYEKMPYQLILEIKDVDAKSTEPLRKELIYNFPDEYLRKDEIRLNQTPAIARFKLIPMLTPEPTAGE